MKSAKENGGASAFPHDQFPGLKGLTKREYFAAMAMQGMLANSIDTNQGMEPTWHLSPERFARVAIHYADALLKELETPE